MVSRILARAEHPVQGIMIQVMLALLPATLFGLLAFGWPAIYLFVTTLLFSLLSEAFCLRLAGKPVMAGVRDGSAALTGWLLAMSLPPWAPWWIGALGAFLAIVVGKQVYGGLGQNLFNPAMLARVALLVSFPLEMTSWVKPGLPFADWTPNPITAWGLTFGGDRPIDAVTSATLIGHIKTAFSQGLNLGEAMTTAPVDNVTLFLGWIPGSLGETCFLLVLAGGVWLMRRGVITWPIPVSLLGGVLIPASLLYWSDSTHYLHPLQHLFSGGLMLTAFFIATDYVTSPSNPKGQLLYGAGCGVLIVAIRSFGGFPEGAGFAILLMNALTPLIDYYVRPRIYGRDIKGMPLKPRNPS